MSNSDLIVKLPQNQYRRTLSYYNLLNSFVCLVIVNLKLPKSSKNMSFVKRFGLDKFVENYKQVFAEFNQ